VSGGISYSWTPETFLSCTNCPNPIASPTENMEYCVASDLNSCVSKACVKIVVTCETASDYSLPNAFSPNGDGNNDEFCIKGWSYCITSFNIRIFDVWGEQVFDPMTRDLVGMVFTKAN